MFSKAENSSAAFKYFSVYCEMFKITFVFLLK